MGLPEVNAVRPFYEVGMEDVRFDGDSGELMGALAEVVEGANSLEDLAVGERLEQMIANPGPERCRPPVGFVHYRHSGEHRERRGVVRQEIFEIVGEVVGHFGTQGN